MHKKIPPPTVKEVRSAIIACKGNCTHISNRLGIAYRKVLTFKSDNRFKATFKKYENVDTRTGPRGVNTFDTLGLEKITATILNCGGIASKVAKKLKVGYMTVYNWKSIPEVAAAFQLAVESNLDLAEDKLITNMKARDDTALIFYLKCKGHKRGYIETQRNVQMTQDEYERMKEDEIESKLTALQRSVAAAENRVAQITE